jgi:hypothetical protein
MELKKVKKEVSYKLLRILICSAADPRSGAFLTIGSGMGKQSRSGSGINFSDHSSESLEIIYFLGQNTYII